MIKLLRVDDRLIHGQVAVSWTSYLGADTIVVANDKAITDKLMQMAFNMAKPPQAVRRRERRWWNARCTWMAGI